MIGVVGPTGGGKSTIMSLIPRFYDPTAGKVLVDGVDVRDYRLQALRDQIGYVLQETVLFRGTVRDNIAYGRIDATEEEIVEAAKLANADEFIARMPAGYHTLVGDRGETLSGGQRQRIGDRARRHSQQPDPDSRRTYGRPGYGIGEVSD